MDLKQPDAAAIGPTPSKVKFYELDITQVEDIVKVVEQVVSWTKQTGAPLGGVINCAGVGRAAKVGEALHFTNTYLLASTNWPMQIIGADGQPHSLDVWNFTMDVNLTGTFNLTRVACKYLVTVPSEGPDGERGVVVMVSSAAAVRWYIPRDSFFSPPFAKKMVLSFSTQFEAQPGQVAYAATKGALVSMTLPMARDLEHHGIRVVTIAPSVFTTPMAATMKPKVQKGISRNLVFPRRLGEPREFGQTVKWILECPYVNGETIRLSGGSRFPGKL